MIKLIKKHKIIVISIFICITFVYLYTQNNWIKVEEFYIKNANITQEYNGFRIVHISDVHLPKNASNVKKIIELVKEQNPNLILMTGDIIDTSANIQNCKLDELCKGLTEICDVYAVTGNHEVWNGHLDLWKQILTDNNVKVIDDTYEIIENNQQKLVICGLSDNTFYSPELFDNADEVNDLFIIMLAHRPELISNYISNDFNMHPNLVLSGHAHGGQFRIPFLGGLVAPDQGLFPNYTSGKYAFENSIMIVSRGLGNSIIPFRINNRPHLPIIILESSK